MAEYQAELPTWEVELARLQQLLPIEARLKSLTGIEIPSLREQIKVQQSLEPDASELVKEVRGFSPLIGSSLTSGPDCHCTSESKAGAQGA